MTRSSNGMYITRNVSLLLKQIPFKKLFRLTAPANFSSQSRYNFTNLDARTAHSSAILNLSRKKVCKTSLRDVSRANNKKVFVSMEFLVSISRFKTDVSLAMIDCLFRIPYPYLHNVGTYMRFTFVCFDV